MKSQRKGMVFAVFFIFILVVLVSKINAQNYLPGNLNNSLEYKNAIVTNIWLEDTSKLDLMKENNIKYLIVDVGDTGKDGKLLTTKEDILFFLNFIQEYEKNNNYTFILLPYSEINTYDYNVNSEFESNFINDYYNLDALGFDGIFVDIEPVRFEQRSSYIQLLSTVRKKLGKDKIISVYSGQIGNDSDNEWEWNINFLRMVSEKVDIISVPVYDTSISNKDEYRKFVRECLDVILKNKWNSYFFLAVPTHKESPETLGNVIPIYIEETNKYPNSKLLGMDIFSEWTISYDGWNVFHSYTNVIKLTPKDKDSGGFWFSDLIAYLRENKICKCGFGILK